MLSRSWTTMGMVFLCAVGCSTIRLDNIEEEVDIVEVDDRIDISGEFCTSPAGDIQYPLKVMFVVDGSGSQQFADQNRQRVVAVQEVINSLLGAPAVEFKIIVFNATVSAHPSPSADPTVPVFTTDQGVLTGALNNLAEADTLTDYQGALALAYTELLKDMDSVDRAPNRGRAELGRTKYMVILISDGLPDPQCLAGRCNDTNQFFPPDPSCGGLNIDRLCEDQQFINCLLQAPGTTCNAGICDFNGTECFEQTEPDQLFGVQGVADSELVGGNDYNQPYQVLQKVADIMELSERFEVGELRVHSGLVLDPQADPAVIAVFGDAAQAAPLMQEIAVLGEGQFMEFYGGDSIDFLSINFDTLKQNRVVRGFYGTNASSINRPAGLVRDSDRDGLTDEEEFEIGSNASLADTDNDGYSDYFEWNFRGYAYKFDDPCLPPIDDTGTFTGVCDPANPTNCAGAPGNYLDSDEDGLHDCEERQLGTDWLNPDTDADGMTDNTDFLMGLDPLRWDYNSDTDQDGIPNGTELEWHLDPAADQSRFAERERYRYDRDFLGYTLDGRSCYDFGVKNMRLVQTRESDDFVGLGVGYNRLELIITENLADALSATPIYRKACIDTRYVPPQLKVPQSGQILLTDADFHYLPGTDRLFSDPRVGGNIFDEDLHCLDGCNENATCGSGQCQLDGCFGGVCRVTNWNCCDNTQCGADQNCVGHTCRPTCNLPMDCPGQSCIEGHCWTPCSTDGDCSNQRSCFKGRCWATPIDEPPPPEPGQLPQVPLPGGF